jgi:hypothetical protein
LVAPLVFVKRPEPAADGDRMMEHGTNLKLAARLKISGRSRAGKAAGSAATPGSRTSDRGRSAPSALRPS